MLNIDLLEDIYYQKEYAKLNLNEEEELFEYKYINKGKIFFNIGIKRRINKIGDVEINEEYFDIETPYGYGGYLTNNFSENFLKEALTSYYKYCIENRVIAEFITFHPFNTFPLSHSDLFDFYFLDRKVVIINLSKSKVERWETYSSNTRNILRNCSKKLKIKKTDNISKFEELYYQTMERNKAREFYYFYKDYFTRLFEMDNVHLFEVSYNDQIISMAFFMYGKNIGHYHLSANHIEYLKLNANYLLLDTVFEDAKENNLKYFLLGGGRTNKEDDGLLKFKMKFSQDLKSFYLAGKIINKEKYYQYLNIWKDQNPGKEIKYFLKYRL